VDANSAAFEDAWDSSKSVFVDNAKIYDGEWEGAKDTVGENYDLVSEKIEWAAGTY